MVWPVVHAIHRRPDLWVDADKFRPERWLVHDEADPLMPKKGAWRPFEQGPRNCVGQELAVIEMKVAMALTLRTYEIRAAYERKLFRAPDEETKSVYACGGLEDPAYQILVATAKPVLGMPAKVCRKEDRPTT